MIWKVWGVLSLSKDRSELKICSKTKKCSELLLLVYTHYYVTIQSILYKLYTQESSLGVDNHFCSYMSMTN